MRAADNIHSTVVKRLGRSSTYAADTVTRLGDALARLQTSIVNICVIADTFSVSAREVERSLLVIRIEELVG